MIVNASLTILVGGILVFSPLSAQDAPPANSSIASQATATKPLEKGQKVPEVKLRELGGGDVTLESLYTQKPLVIVFFRGGWCPICTRHTQQLIRVYPQLKEAGYEMIGISPDSVESSNANVNKSSIPFPIYSDSNVQAASRFGLAFTVDDGTVNKYKGFGIDLEKASGQSHHALPIPAIYIVNKQGVVTFAHSNPDYRQRLDVKALIAAPVK